MHIRKQVVGFDHCATVDDVLIELNLATWTRGSQQSLAEHHHPASFLWSQR